MAAESRGGRFPAPGADRTWLDPRRWQVNDRIDAAACLVLLVACTLAKLALLQPVGPLIFFDELLYRQGAEALAGQGPYPSGHYPFLYPLLLAPGEALHAGFRGIFVANVLATSALIPACWLLGRTIGMKWAWPCALAAALLPIQWVFPVQVMAENLFVPLFAWAVWYAIRARVPGAAASLVYGASLASLFLVKYLALPAIPLIWATWLFGLASREVRWRSLSRIAALSLAGMAAMVIAWIAYAQANGIALDEAFGSKVSGLHAGELMTPAAVAMWAAAYLCALILLAAPFLPRFAEALGALAVAPRRLLRESPLARLTLLFALLAGGYWLICVQHSAGAMRNYPVPQRVVVRYLMHLLPLVAVLGLALTLRPDPRPRLRHAVPLAAIAAGAVWVAHQVLYADLAWDFPPWFAAIPLYSTDILGFREPSMLWPLLGLVAASAFVGLHRSIAWAWVAAWLLLLGMATLVVQQRAERDSTTRPSHARALAPLLANATRRHENVLVITELRREPPVVLRQALMFWGADPGAFRVIGPGQAASAQADKTEVLRITMKPRPGDEVLRYPVGNATGYIYREHSDGNGRPETPAGNASLLVEPAFACAGSRPRVATLAWDARASGAGRVMLFIGTRDGGEKPFTGGIAHGSRTTGPWARPGMVFRLRDGGSGRLLAETVLEARDCR